MKQTKFRNTVNLAETKFGSKIIFKTDQFFGAAERILSSEKPIFKDGLYDSHGKWMDGWETRRKRKAGHDYLIIKLGRPGKIYNVDIDTSFFFREPTFRSIFGSMFLKKKSNKKNYLEDNFKKEKAWS